MYIVENDIRFIQNLPAVVGVCIDVLGVGPSEEDGVGMLLYSEPSSVSDVNGTNNNYTCTNDLPFVAVIVMAFLLPLLKEQESTCSPSTTWRLSMVRVEHTILELSVGV